MQRIENFNHQGELIEYHLLKNKVEKKEKELTNRFERIQNECPDLYNSALQLSQNEYNEINQMRLKMLSIES